MPGCSRQSGWRDSERGRWLDAALIVMASPRAWGGEAAVRFHDRAGAAACRPAGSGYPAGESKRYQTRDCPRRPRRSMEYLLKRGSDAARWFDADLRTFVHVVRRPALPPWLRPSKRVERSRLVRARQAVEQASARVPAGIKVRTVILTGDPASEIAVDAASGPSSLCMMTLRSQGAARKGSTTNRVLAHGVAPVLALPRPG